MTRVGSTMLSLDGTWKLEILGQPVPRTSTVVVPGPWTVQVPGFGNSHATVRYYREFVWSPVSGARTFLVFEGVAHSATVWVNDELIGSHDGGWEPFSLEVGDALSSGSNRVTVEVGYPKPFAVPGERGQLDTPHGKQSWYGTTAGIWQSVRLEARPKTHLEVCRVNPIGASGQLRVEGLISGEWRQAMLAVDVFFEGEVVAQGTFECLSREVGFELQVPEVKLWGIGTPNRYEVRCRLWDGAECDEHLVTTGFRTFETKGGQLLLNGHPLELRAVLDQDYHPGVSSTPPDLQEWEELLRSAQGLGFNMLRVHIKRPDPRYYEIADRLGMLVWTELPSWLTWTPEAAREGLELLLRLIKLDGHHPSIVVWTIINEGWGIDLESSTQRRWLKEAFEAVREAAPNALVVDNSACVPNYHLVSDLDDYHFYRGIPESRHDWDDLVAEFASRPSWAWSPHGDAERTGGEPLVLSEFGNWGLPMVVDQYENGREPWWFGLGADWAYGAGEGAGLLDRYERHGVAEAFGGWNALVSELQRAQLIANRYQTTSIRAQKALSGYVVTQLSDVAWEANGLFDMQRQPKEFTAEFALANGERAVVLRPDQYSLATGETTAVRVTVTPARSGYARQSEPGVVSLTLGGNLVGQVAGDADAWVTHQLQIQVPVVPGCYELVAELHEQGVLVARDAAELIVTTAQENRPTPAPLVVDDEGLAQWVAKLGWQSSMVRDMPDSGSLLITRRFGEKAQQFAREGGSVLVLAEDEDALGGAYQLLTAAKLRSRSGDGDWVPRTDWLRRSGPFAQLPGGTVLGIAFEEMLGDLVLTGVPNPIRPAQVWSGVFNGWLQGNAATTATLRSSQGQVTVTTLRLRATVDTVALSAALGRATVECCVREISPSGDR